jgi:hypothetical protein
MKYNNWMKDGVGGVVINESESLDRKASVYDLRRIGDETDAELAERMRCRLQRDPPTASPYFEGIVAALCSVKRRRVTSRSLGPGQIQISVNWPWWRLNRRTRLEARAACEAALVDIVPCHVLVDVEIS